MKFYFYGCHLWQFQRLFLQADISIYHIRCIRFPGMFFWFIIWKSHFRFPKKFPEGSFQVPLHICQCKRICFFQPWIFFFISGRCIFQHLFFFLVITDLICKHLVIKKTAAADCFLYLNYLLFIWIDPYFYCPVYLSHPDFLYTDGLLLLVPHLQSAGKNSGSRILLSTVSLLSMDILFSTVCYWHFYTH